MREIVLDTETTGLDPASGHRVLEIGAVELFNQAPTGQTFHVLINPERNVPEEATRVHGHTTGALQDKPNFSGIVDSFLGFLGEAQIVIHNAEFDVRFLNAELSRLGRQLIETGRVVDTLALARRRHPGQANSLDALCDRYRIDRSRRVKHGALLDAEILVEVYCELTGGRQRSLIFKAEPRVAATTIRLPAAPTAPRRPRTPLISAEETAEHMNHGNNFGENAIWHKLRLAAA
jgi:DNA polymerase III subunit epsilon